MPGDKRTGTPPGQDGQADDDSDGDGDDGDDGDDDHKYWFGHPF